MNPTPTLEQSLAEMQDEISNTALHSDIERKALLHESSPSSVKAAESIGGLMILVWKLFRLVKTLADINKELREESMQLREVKRATAGANLKHVAKAELN